MIVISIVGIAYINMYVYICMVLRAVVQPIGHCLLSAPMIAKIVCNYSGTISSTISFNIFLSQKQMGEKEIQQAEIYCVTYQEKNR